MKNTIKTNYIFNTGYQIFALIVPLITTPYISRVLTADGIGIYSYTYSIVSYFVLIAVLGTSKYGVVNIGIFQDDIKKRSIKFWEIYIFRLFSTIIMLLAYLTYCYFESDNKIISVIQSIYIISVIFDVSWFFQGMEDFKKIAIRNFIIKIINIIYIFLVVKTETDLWKYVLGLAFFTFLGNFVMCINLPKYITKVKFKELKPFKDVKTIIQLFIPTVATQVYEMIDKTMIGAITGIDAENGYYEQASKIIRMSLVIITTLSTVMIPKISKDYANKNFKEVNKKVEKSYRFVWFLGIPMMLGIIGVTDSLVPTFFGQGYDKVKILLPVLSILFIPMGLNSITGNQYLIATGQQNQYTKMLLIGGSVNIIFNAILIPHLYSLGASIASILGEIVIMILGFIYLEKTRQFKIKTILKMSYKYILSGIGMYVIIKLLSNYVANSLVQIGVIIIIGIIIYAIELIILKDVMIIEILKFIEKKLKIERDK